MRRVSVILFMLIYILPYTQEVQMSSDEYVSQDKAELLFLKANKAYEQAEYETAILIYDNIENSELVSWELYYNKANSFYKMNNTAYAIINYERALRLSPNNNDVLFNLRLANAKTVDKIEAIPRLLISSWWISLGNVFSSKLWAVLFLLSFMVALFMAGMFYVSRQKEIKKLAIVLFFLFSLISTLNLSLTVSQYKKETRKTAAIIISDNEYVKYSPSQTGKDAFILHEGTKVSILDALENWYEIKLADGKRGWIPLNSIEII